MTERLLQYIWQFQHFNGRQLYTVDGSLLHIINPGKYNTNQGPDFLEAAIKLDGIILAGNIELHIQTSDWKKHGHQHDSNYKNVILHVVWQHDIAVHDVSIPVLVLENRIASVLLDLYTAWMQRTGSIPCGSMVQQVSQLVWVGWTERLLVERMMRKSNYVLQLLQENNQHWEEACWQLLAKNFGIRVNATAFENIAKSLPLSIMGRHKNQPTVLEALLMGQAGLLEQSFKDEYGLLLQREYRFHRHKYQFRKPAGAVFFLRMRPAAFPTIRLSQLATLLHTSTRLFTEITETESLPELRSRLNVCANDYWHYHFRFDESGEYSLKQVGSSMISNIVINTVAPLLFAWGVYHKEKHLKDKALQWLTETTSEKNSIITAWQQLGVGSANAGESQALLELKINYCDEKRCLDCAVGNALLKRNG